MSRRDDTLPDYIRLILYRLDCRSLFTEFCSGATAGHVTAYFRRRSPKISRRVLSPVSAAANYSSAAGILLRAKRWPIYARRDTCRRVDGLKQ